MKDPMAQDERAVVRQAQQAVHESLHSRGVVLPGAVMLVGRDPDSGEPLLEKRAIGMTEEQPFAGEEEFESFIGGLRAEALRLEATAIAIIGEASADIIDGTPTRVALIRVEDEGGVDLMHAKIESGRVGDFLATPDAPDIIDKPILSARGG